MSQREGQKGKDLPSKQQGIGVAGVSNRSVFLCRLSLVEQVAVSQYFSDSIHVVSAGTYSKSLLVFPHYDALVLTGECFDQM